MAASAGALLVRLGLDASEYTAGLTKAEQQAQRFAQTTARNSRINISGAGADALVKSFTEGSRAATRFGQSVARSSSVASDSLKSLEGTARSVKATFGTVIAAFGAREIVLAADSWTTLNQRMRIVAPGANDLKIVMGEVMNIAQETRQPLKQVGDLYFRLAQSTSRLGISQQDTLKVTDVLNKALIVSGASGVAAEAAMIQFSQGLQSGRFSGQEFNSVNEQANRVIVALADGLGVTVDKMRSLAEAGDLKPFEIFKALLSQAAKINSEFQNIPDTIAGAFTRVQNKFVEFIGTTGQASGAIGGLVNTMQFFSKQLDVLGAIALGVGAGLLGKVFANLGKTVAASIAPVIGAAEAHRTLGAVLQSQVVSQTTLAATRTASIAATIQETQATLAALAARRAELLVLRESAAAEILATSATNASAAARARNVVAIGATIGANEALIATNARILATTQALTVAKDAQTAAQMRQAGAAIIGVTAGIGTSAAATGRALLALVGGPIGAVLTALSVGVGLWAAFGQSANDSAKVTERSTADILDDLERQNKALQARLTLAKQGNEELARGPQGDLAARLQEQILLTRASITGGDTGELGADVARKEIARLEKLHGELLDDIGRSIAIGIASRTKFDVSAGIQALSLIRQKLNELREALSTGATVQIGTEEAQQRLTDLEAQWRRLLRLTGDMSELKGDELAAAQLANLATFNKEFETKQQEFKRLVDKWKTQLGEDIFRKEGVEAKVRLKVFGEGSKKTPKEDDVSKAVEAFRTSQIAEPLGLESKTVDLLHQVTKAAKGYNLTQEQRIKWAEQVLAADSNVKKAADDRLRIEKALLDVQQKAIESSEERVRKAEEEAGAVGLIGDALIDYQTQLRRAESQRNLVKDRTKILETVPPQLDTAALAQSVVKLGAATALKLPPVMLKVELDQAAANDARDNLAAVRTDLLAIPDRNIKLAVDAETARKNVTALDKDVLALRDRAVVVSVDAQRGELAPVRKELLALADRAVSVDVDAGTAAADIAAIREGLLAIVNRFVKLNVDADPARISLAAVNKDLLAVADRAVKLQFDAAALDDARRSIAVLGDDIESVADRTVRLDLDSATARADAQTFASEIKAISNRAVSISLEAGAAREGLADVRADLLALADRAVKLDVDSGTSREELAAVRAGLLEIADRAVQIEVNTGTARVDLTALGTALKAVVDRTVKVDVDAVTARATLSAVGKDALALPNQRLIKVDVEARAARDTLVAVTQQTAALVNRVVELDVKGSARDELIGIRKDLLSIVDRSVNLDVNAAVARAELLSVGDSLRVLVDRTVKIAVDPVALDNATRGIDGVTRQIATIADPTIKIGIDAAALGTVTTALDALGRTVNASDWTVELAAEPTALAETRRSIAVVAKEARDLADRAVRLALDQSALDDSLRGIATVKGELGEITEEQKIRLGVDQASLAGVRRDIKAVATELTDAAAAAAAAAAKTAALGTTRKDLQGAANAARLLTAEETARKVDEGDVREGDLKKLARRKQLADDARKASLELVEGYVAEFGAIGKVGIELQHYNIELAKQKALKDILNETDRKFIDNQFEIAKSVVTALDAQKRKLEEVISANDTFRSSFIENLNAIVGGTKSFKDAVKDMADSVVAKLNDIASTRISDFLFGEQGSAGGGFFDIGKMFQGIIGGGKGGDLKGTQDKTAAGYTAMLTAANRSGGGLTELATSAALTNTALATTVPPLTLLATNASLAATALATVSSASVVTTPLKAAESIVGVDALGTSAATAGANMTALAADTSAASTALKGLPADVAELMRLNPGKTVFQQPGGPATLRDAGGLARAQGEAEIAQQLQAELVARTTSAAETAALTASTAAASTGMTTFAAATTATTPPLTLLASNASLAASALATVAASSGGGGLASLFGGGGSSFGGAGTDWTFGFKRGGMPPVNKPSWVGEDGPELFVPRVAGTIVPNNEIKNVGGKQVSIVQHISVPANMSRASASQFATQVGLQTQRALARDA